jgi:MoaA/NifB/PqqE/SkfB family radical SAM enzyme
MEATKDINHILGELKGQPYREYRRKYEDARLGQIRTELPLELHLELVSYCNLRYKMCYRSFASDRERGIMPLNMVDNIVNQAKDMGVSSLHIGLNTEPTLHPDILTVLKKFCKVNAQDFWLRTNGLKLTNEISELITDIPITKLSVSIDAATKETYAKIRGGDYDAVIENVMNFLDIRRKKKTHLPFLRVTMVEQEESHGETEKFYDMWENVADIVDIQGFIDFKHVKDRKISEIKLEDHTGLDCPFPYMYYALAVSYDGRIRPCCYANHEVDALPPTSLSDCTLREYWNSEAVRNFIQMIHDKKYQGSCLECIIANYKV